jgi:hypothetical protein
MDIVADAPADCRLTEGVKLDRAICFASPLPSFLESCFIIRIECPANGTQSHVAFK